MNKYQEAFWEIEAFVNSAVYDSSLRSAKNSMKVIEELVDRAKPKKTVEKIIDGYIWRACPNCNDVFTLENVGKNFCPDCGQALDWKND